MEVKRLNPVPTGHRRLLKWVEYWACLCEPIGVYWCDGSRSEYDRLLKEMIERHRTTLVFTNTRSGTESVVYKLKERGLEDIGVHHGSLSRETRLEVEDDLRGHITCIIVLMTHASIGDFFNPINL